MDYIFFRYGVHVMDIHSIEYWVVGMREVTCIVTEEYHMANIFPFFRVIEPLIHISVKPKCRLAD